MGIRSAVQSFMRELRQASPLQQMIEARATLLGAFGSGKIPVNERTAFTLSAFFASVRTISEMKASLPIEVLEIKPDGSKAVTTQHQVAGLLERPNRDMTQIVAGEVRQAHLCTHGNSYSELTLDRRGDVVAITPVHPTAVDVMRDPVTRDLLYRVTDEDGRTQTLDASRMLHVPGFGGDGLVGWSPLKLFAGTLGMGLESDRFQLAFMGNQCKPSIVVTCPNNPPPEQKSDIERKMQAGYSGSQSGSAMVLYGGMDAKTLSMSLVDAQFLESRKANSREIVTRIFKLPPSAVGEMEGLTRDALEAQDRYLAKHTLRPWCKRDEQELERKLFRQSDLGRFRIRYNIDALLRADIKSRYEAHRLALMVAWMTVNEVRALEDLPPVDGGDALARPAAIWGNPTALPGDTPEGAPTSEPQQDRSHVDPRLVALTTQTLRSLFQRTATVAARSARKGSSAQFREDCERALTQQRNLLEDRLQALGGPSAELQAVCQRHREQLQAVAGETDLPAAVDRVVRSWDRDACDLALRLLTRPAESLGLDHDLFHTGDDDE